MIFFVANFLSNLLGWDLTKTLKRVQLGLIILGLIAIAAAGLWIRSCVTRHNAKLDQKAIEKINKADRTERLQELSKVVTENSDVTKTVDQRNTIAEVNETEKQAQVNAKVLELDEQVQAAKKGGHDVTGSELDCMMTKENCQ